MTLQIYIYTYACNDSFSWGFPWLHPNDNFQLQVSKFSLDAKETNTYAHRYRREKKRKICQRFAKFWCANLLAAILPAKFLFVCLMRIYSILPTIKNNSSSLYDFSLSLLFKPFYYSSNPLIFFHHKKKKRRRRGERKEKDEEQACIKRTLGQNPTCWHKKNIS